MASYRGYAKGRKNLLNSEPISRTPTVPVPDGFRPMSADGLPAEGDRFICSAGDAARPSDRL